MIHPNVPDWVIAANLRRSVNTSDRPDRAFVLSITDRCNFRCDLCCHPARKSDISTEDAEKLVREACELDFDEVCVTGGEPFLRRDAIFRLAAITRARQKLFGVISNGYWAADREEAFRLARRLIEAGVTRMTISWDPSHGRFAHPQTAQNAVDACMDAGMRVCLTGSFAADGDHHGNYGIDISAYRGLANFITYAFPISPAGRAAGVARPPTGGYEGAGCPAQRDELVVYARNGLTLPCCSLYAGYSVPGLSLGDWRRHTVEDLLLLHEGDPLYRIISGPRGFAALYDLLAEIAPRLADDLPPLSTFASACQACAFLMAAQRGPAIRRSVIAHVVRHVERALDASGLSAPAGGRGEPRIDAGIEDA